MEQSLLIAGFGGQGVMLIGKTLSHASVDAGKFSTFFPAYGAEQRGGTANCTVIVRDSEPIDCPLREQFDTIIIMNELSFTRFAGALKPGGTLMINSSLVEARPDPSVKTVTVDTAKIAGEVGSPKEANMVMLGAYIGYTGIYDVDAIKKLIGQALAKRPEMAELNARAIDAGVAAVSAS